MYDNNTIEECGCKRHTVNTNDGDTIWYDHDWWSLQCLCIKKDKRYEIILAKQRILDYKIEVYKRMQAKFIKMKNYMRKTPCFMCGKTVGNRWEHHGDEVICSSCERETRIRE